jgi:hypothetical protein
MKNQKQAFELITKTLKNKKNVVNTLVTKLHVPASEAKEFLKAYKGQNELKETKGDKVKWDQKKDEATINAEGSIKTLEEILIESKVDLNIWVVESYQITKWDMGRKDISKSIKYTNGTINGFTKDSGQVNVKQLYRIMVKLKRKVGINVAKELLEFFKKDLAEFINPDKWFSIIPAVSSNINKKYCLELAIPDLHIGKLGWAPETNGFNYDSSEAIKVFELAVKDLLNKAPLEQVDTILLPCGSDFFHTDNAKDETTSGTYVGTDSRWQKVFMKGCNLLTKVITELAFDKKVIVPIIPGNHDFEKSFFLGEYLKAFFQNHPNVEINNTPTTRKYFRYGATLLGFTHGSEEKHSTLPLILATERANDWSQTQFREVHVGHLHKESNDEYQGVKVRFLPSLCSADAWHTKSGYVGSIRAATAFLWDFNKGLEAQYYFNL